MLFFKSSQLHTFGAQFFGFVVNLGFSALNGIVVGWLLRFSGRDFAYVKSTVVCSGFTILMFMVINPLLGGKVMRGNILTTYLALITTIGFAVLLAYLFFTIYKYWRKEKCRINHILKRTGPVTPILDH
jgi:hypothetical protein